MGLLDQLDRLTDLGPRPASEAGQLSLGVRAARDERPIGLGVETKTQQRKVAAVDFDGVLHADMVDSDSPVPMDAPIRGAQDFIRGLQEQGYDVTIFSHRAGTKEGEKGIRDWLSKHEFPDLPVTAKKPPADIYIDDRAYRFQGDYGHALGFTGSEATTPWNRVSP